MAEVEVLSPSRLGAAELAAWKRMMVASPHLQRAFFSPEFARACEEAFGRAYVAVLHKSGAIRAFLPFQFKSAWHARLRLAERIGGELCDSAGLIAEPGFVIDPATLLRCCGLGVLFMTHLPEGQEAFGLTATAWRTGYLIDLSAGSDAYFARLSVERKEFVHDTERRLRRAAREYGPPRFDVVRQPTWHAVLPLLTEKRQQYRRTSVGDVFSDRRRLRLIEALTEAPALECELVLTSLIAGERMLAQHLGIRHRDVFSGWFPVYDPEVQKISPGRLLRWHFIEQSEALGVRLVDLGEGDSEAKRDFSTGTARFGRANFVAGTPRGGLARLGQMAEWRLRKLTGAGGWHQRSAL